MTVKQYLLPSNLSNKSIITGQVRVPFSSGSKQLPVVKFTSTIKEVRRGS